MRMTLFLLRVLFLTCITVSRVPAQQSASPRILMMIGDGFNGNEFWEPYFAFRASTCRVDVASYTKGPVKCGNRGDVNIDFQPNYLLEEVDTRDYDAFFLPGGKGPEALERYPLSLEICRRFDEQKTLISSLCHGPRLLGQSGVMKDRMTTYLAKVRDEIPEHYAAGDLGHYRDLPLVRDGHLITSRYPEDVVILTRATLEELASNYPACWPAKEARILLIHGQLNKLETYAFLRGGLKSHSTVQTLPISRLSGWLEQKENGAGSFDLMVVLQGKEETDLTLENQKKLAALWGQKPILASAEMEKKLRKQFPQVTGLSGSPEDQLMQVTQKAYSLAKESRAKAEPSWNAFLAIETDFDEEAYLVMKNWLELQDYRVATISASTGPVKSMNGLLVRANLSYKDIKKVKAGLPVVDPGGLWPYEEDLKTEEREHFDWIFRQLQYGAFVMSIGFASYYLASLEDFKGMEAATTDQGEWSFAKRGGASFSREASVWTTKGLLTVKSTAHLREAIQKYEHKLYSSEHD